MVDRGNWRFREQMWYFENRMIPCGSRLGDPGLLTLNVSLRMCAETTGCHIPMRETQVGLEVRPPVGSEGGQGEFGAWSENH